MFIFPVKTGQSLIQTQRIIFFSSWEKGKRLQALESNSWKLGVFDEKSITRAFKKEEKSQAKESNSENSNFGMFCQIGACHNIEREATAWKEKLKNKTFCYFLSCIFLRELFGCVWCLGFYKIALVLLL